MYGLLSQIVFNPWHKPLVSHLEKTDDCSLLYLRLMQTKPMQNVLLSQEYRNDPGIALDISQPPCDNGSSLTVVLGKIA